MNFMEKEKPIGVFDSGIGGLTVVKRIISALPNERIIYFGDTARVPYGSKSNETVIEYSLQNARFLINKNVKAIVVACNTASSVAIPALKKHFNVPVIGMIEAGTKYALKVAPEGTLGIIGTISTISNKAYSGAVKIANPEKKVIEKACPLFVPLVEEGWTNHPATRLIAEEYLSEMKAMGVSSLILGCTHYPLLSGIIQEVMGSEVTLIDSGVAAADMVRQELERIGLRTNSSAEGSCEFYVSDYPQRFHELAELFLGRSISNVWKIDLEYLQSLSFHH